MTRSEAFATFFERLLWVFYIFVVIVLIELALDFLGLPL